MLRRISNLVSCGIYSCLAVLLTVQIACGETPTPGPTPSPTITPRPTPIPALLTATMASSLRQSWPLQSVSADLDSNLSAAVRGPASECVLKLDALIQNTKRLRRPDIARLLQALCLVEVDNLSAALAVLQEALTLRASNSDIVYLMGLGATSADERLLRFKESLIFDRFEYFQRLDVLTNTVDLMMSKSLPMQASTLLERWVTDEPKMRARLIDLYTQSGRRGLALEFARKALKEEPLFDAPIAKSLARSLLANSDRLLYAADNQEALTLIQKVIATGDSSADAQSVYGNALLGVGKTRDALAAATAALKTYPADAELQRIQVQAQKELNLFTPIPTAAPAPTTVAVPSV